MSSTVLSETFERLQTGGWIANFIVGIVLMLLSPIAARVLQRPKIAIVSAAAGLTVLVWVIAIAALRSVHDRAESVVSSAAVAVPADKHLVIDAPPVKQKQVSSDEEMSSQPATASQKSSSATSAPQVPKRSQTDGKQSLDEVASETSTAAPSTLIKTDTKYVSTQPTASMASYTYFLHEPYTDLAIATEEAKKQGKLIFVVIYDETHPKLSKLDYSLGYFMEYHTTKKLVDQYFVPVLLKASSDQARRFVPDDDPLENCRWVVINTRGDILRSEGVYANSDEGLKRVREVIALSERK